MSAYVRPRERRETTLSEPREAVCGGGGQPPPRLLTVVYSAPENRRQRDVIRATWGAGLRALPAVKLIFLMGKSSGADSGIVSAREEEQKAHQDLVVEDFVESYFNLTVKTAFMLKWVTGNDCRRSKFVFKVDDDSFVNPSVLWKNLEHALLRSVAGKTLAAYTSEPDEEGAAVAGDVEAEESLDYLYTGHVMSSATPIRDYRSKWYSPSKFYPLNVFPKFASGSGYVFTASVADALYNCALKTPYFNLEDVFLGGLCATSQLGLVLTHNPTFHFRKPLVSPNYICYYKTSSLIHPLTPVEMSAMYERISKEDHNCDTFYFAAVKASLAVVEFLKNLFRL